MANIYTYIGNVGPYIADSDSAHPGVETSKEPTGDNQVVRYQDIYGELNRGGFTKSGGLWVLLKNGTGGTSIKGQVVRASKSSDESFETAPGYCMQPLGVIYDHGRAPGAWTRVLIAGRAQVLIKDGTAARRGAWVAVSDTLGRAKANEALPPREYCNTSAAPTTLATTILSTEPPTTTLTTEPPTDEPTTEPLNTEAPTTPIPTVAPATTLTTDPPTDPYTEETTEPDYDTRICTTLTTVMPTTEPPSPPPPTTLATTPSPTTAEPTTEAPTTQPTTVVPLTTLAPYTDLPCNEDDHWRQIGYCLETIKPGTDVLAWCVLHFN